MKSKKAKRMTSKYFIKFLYYFVKAYLWTVRLQVVNEKPWLDHVEGGGRVLLCAWHQQFFSFIRYFGKFNSYNPSLMISRSKDGEIISGVANLIGWQTVRGSSSRGGRTALRKMVENLSVNGLAAHVVDGPRGPIGIVKGGVIAMAREADAAIVPVYAEAENAWYFNSWDRFMLPKPFSKVTVRYGDMVTVEKSDAPNLFEQQRKALEETMRPALK